MIILVPSPLSQITPVLPVLDADLALVRGCTRWLVENAKPARAALQLLKPEKPIRELEIIEIGPLDSVAIRALVQEAKAGLNTAVMSDAGCPGIADPGSWIVAMAHQLHCPVKPLVGPSSIVLALMASGLNGQSFRFYGYPPIDDAARHKWIAQSEVESRQQQSTQIVIETPFRNDKFLMALLKHLSPTTRLCIASDLTGSSEAVLTLQVKDWKLHTPNLGKVPTLFLWQAN